MPNIIRKNNNSVDDVFNVVFTLLSRDSRAIMLTPSGKLYTKVEQNVFLHLSVESIDERAFMLCTVSICGKSLKTLQ